MEEKYIRIIQEEATKRSTEFSTGFQHMQKEKWFKKGAEWFLNTIHAREMAKKDAEIDRLRAVLRDVRSQMMEYQDYGLALELIDQELKESSGISEKNFKRKTTVLDRKKFPEFIENTISINGKLAKVERIYNGSRRFEYKIYMCSVCLNEFIEPIIAVSDQGPALMSTDCPHCRKHVRI